MKTSIVRLQLNLINAKLFASNKDEELDNILRAMNNAINALGSVTAIQPLIDTSETFFNSSEEEQMQMIQQWHDQLEEEEDDNGTL